jgi:hypothetical protein
VRARKANPIQSVARVLGFYFDTRGTTGFAYLFTNFEPPRSLPYSQPGSVPYPEELAAYRTAGNAKSPKNSPGAAVNTQEWITPWERFPPGEHVAAKGASEPGDSAEVGRAVSPPGTPPLSAGSCHRAGTEGSNGRPDDAETHVGQSALGFHCVELVRASRRGSMD